MREIARASQNTYSQHHLDYLLQHNKGRRTHKWRRVHACQPADEQDIKAGKGPQINWNKTELFGKAHSFAKKPQTNNPPKKDSLDE